MILEGSFLHLKILSASTVENLFGELVRFAFYTKIQICMSKKKKFNIERLNLPHTFAVYRLNKQKAK